MAREFAKLIKSENGDQYISYKGFEGTLDDLEDSGTVEFTCNVAPDDLEDCTDTVEMRDRLKSNIDYMTRFQEFLTEIGEAEITTDFYWMDRDLLIRVTIPKDHKILKHLKL